MTKHNSDKAQVFWFGFACGTIGALSCAYFLGTKTGRQSLLSIIHFSENLEGNIKKLVKNQQALSKKNTSDTISPMEKIGAILNEIKNISKST